MNICRLQVAADQAIEIVGNISLNGFELHKLIIAVENDSN